MKTKLLKLYLKFVKKKIYKEHDEGFILPTPFDEYEWLYDVIIKNRKRSYVHYCAKECWLEEKSNMNWQSGQYSNSRKEIQALNKKYERCSRKYWTPKAIMERNLKGEC